MSNPEKLKILPATAADISLVFELIRELAEYEKNQNQLTMSEKDLYASLFSEKPAAEAIIAYLKDEPIGYALFYENYSALSGKRGLFMHDLYVRSQYRGKGFGRSLVAYSAKLAKQRGCYQLDWFSYEWNKKAIAFYQTIGAMHLGSCMGFRVVGESLMNLAEEVV